jgi:hypothetical protein
MARWLVPDWKQAPKFWSVQLIVLGAVFSGIASVLGVFGGLPWVQNHPFLFLGIAAIVNVAALAGRLVDQPNVPVV